MPGARRTEVVPAGPGIAVAALLGLGLTLRAVHFVAARSLWIDEARIAINVLSRPYRGLLLPLDFDQSAPPGFLWLVKLAAAGLGPGERPLRLVAFLAGAAALGLVYPLARRLVSPPAALFVVAAFCLSPPLIYYSNELKPYMVDALAAVGLVLLTLRWVETGGDRRWGLGLTAAGALAVWLSTPSFAVLAGIGAAILVCPLVDRRRRLLLAAWASVAWLSSFLLVFLLTHRASAANPYLQEFWAFRFLDPGQPQLVARAWLAFRDFFWELLVGASADPPLPAWATVAATGLAVAVLGLMAVGSVRLASAGGGWRVVLLAGPLVVVAGAAGFQMYPIALRLMLFAAPLALVLVAAGAARLIDGAGPRASAALWAGFAALLLTVPLARDLAFAASPERWDGHRHTMREFQRLARPGDPVYVSAGSIPAWVYYTTDWTRPDTAWLGAVARVASYNGPAFENAAPRDTVRIEDGDGLTYDRGGRTVLLGLATGMHARAGKEFSRLKPSPGWGEVEAARMKAVANPRLWVILSRVYGLEDGVFRRIAHAGGTLRFRSEHGESHLAEYRFTGPGGLR